MTKVLTHAEALAVEKAADQIEHRPETHGILCPGIRPGQKRMCAWALIGWHLGMRDGTAKDVYQRFQLGEDIDALEVFYGKPSFDRTPRTVARNMRAWLAKQKVARASARPPARGARG